MIFEKDLRVCAISSRRSSRGVRSRRLCLKWLLAGSFGLAAGLSGAAEYQVGDRARADIVTPVQLIVVDRERTEVLRQKEAQRVPAMFRHDTNAAAEAELKMLAAYTGVKESFEKALQRAYKKRRLDAEAVEQERFGRLVATFGRQNRSFPLTTNLAVFWALDEPDQDLMEELTAALREPMQHLIRADRLPALAKAGPQQARLVPVALSNALVDLDTALAASTPFHKTNLVAIGRARKELQAKFSGEQGWAGKFLARFVRESCVFDEALTVQSRARRTDPILSADTYEAGRVIVRAGELIDLKVKAALDELARRTEAQLSQV
ncbi:MAG: hypothetical protein L0Y58_14340 [Verrucomicrobia subdivision 3 bacterium]|nr:hypothetical protein [Limisphaerales bacterium]